MNLKSTACPQSNPKSSYELLVDPCHEGFHENSQEKANKDNNTVSE